MSNEKRNRFTLEELSEISKLSDVLIDAADIIKRLQGDSILTSELVNGFHQLKSLIGENTENKNTVKKVYCLRSEEYFGDIGEYTGYKDYHVGDIVVHGYGSKTMIVKKNGQYFAYGWRGMSIREMESREDLRFRIEKSFNDYSPRELNIGKSLIIKNSI